MPVPLARGFLSERPFAADHGAVFRNPWHTVTHVPEGGVSAFSTHSLHARPGCAEPRAPARARVRKTAPDTFVRIRAPVSDAAGTRSDLRSHVLRVPKAPCKEIVANLR